MAIPPFNEHGWLPEGIHDCTLEEAAARFGGFQRSDRRPQLWARFVEFVREAQTVGLIDAMIVDGSFVTAEPLPHDIDLVVVLTVQQDWSGDLSPAQYNVLSQRRVRQRFGFDIVVATQEHETLAQAVAFFAQVRQRPGAKKAQQEGSCDKTQQASRQRTGKVRIASSYSPATSDKARSW